ncbi:response regulator [Elusimicrobiota bacterium]
MNYKEKKTYSTADISKLLDVYPATVAKWIDKGELKAYVTPGGHRKVKKMDLLDFMNKYKMPIPEDFNINHCAKILVVDDEEEIVRSISRALEKKIKNCKVYSASNGFAAGHAVSSVKPEIIILDIMLPGIDGFTVCRQIREKHIDSKIIAITGYPSEENRKKMFECGADHFFAKPFELQELMEIIEQILNL